MYVYVCVFVRLRAEWVQTRRLWAWVLACNGAAQRNPPVVRTQLLLLMGTARKQPFCAHISVSYWQ